jgi:hypothetical protein
MPHTRGQPYHPMTQGKSGRSFKVLGKQPPIVESASASLSGKAQ